MRHTLDKTIQASVNDLITKLQLIRGQHDDVIIQSQNTLRFNLIIWEKPDNKHKGRTRQYASQPQSVKTKEDPVNSQLKWGNSNSLHSLKVWYKRPSQLTGKMGNSNSLHFFLKSGTSGCENGPGYKNWYEYETYEQESDCKDKSTK